MYKRDIPIELMMLCVFALESRAYAESSQPPLLQCVVSKVYEEVEEGDVPESESYGGGSGSGRRAILPPPTPEAERAPRFPRPSPPFGTRAVTIEDQNVADFPGVPKILETLRDLELEGSGGYFSVEAVEAEALRGLSSEELYEALKPEIRNHFFGERYLPGDFRSRPESRPPTARPSRRRTRPDPESE